MRSDDPAFLGRGWSFPPSFVRTAAAVEMVSGAEDIRQSLWILLSTAVGERVMVRKYGCSLTPLLFESVTLTLLTKLQEVVRRAILSWEPRITVESIVATVDPADPGLVRISIDYTIRKTNTRGNLVYPFCVREGALMSPAP